MRVEIRNENGEITFNVNLPDDREAIEINMIGDKPHFYIELIKFPQFNHTNTLISMKAVDKIILSNFGEIAINTAENPTFGSTRFYLPIKNGKKIGVKFKSNSDVSFISLKDSNYPDYIEEFKKDLVDLDNKNLLEYF